MTRNNRKEKRPDRLRVLISGTVPPPIGGMATYYQALINSSLSESVDYQFVQTSTHKREFSSSGRATLTNLFYAIGDCARYTKALFLYRPLITHIGTAFRLSFLKHSYCVLISRLMGKRVILHPHCSLSVLYHDRTGIWKWFFRQVIKNTDGVIALSQEWIQLNAILPEKCVYYLPNFVDIDEYRSALENHQTKVKVEGTLSVLYVGYLGKAKGIFDLIDAVNLVRTRGIDMVFELVGSELTPGEVELIQAKIKSFQLSDLIRLNKPAYDKDKVAYFRNADIFIYPSHHEGIPMAVLEAMASGLPVIATRVGGLPDLIKENGILVDAEQPEQLADALCHLAENPNLRKEMQAKSYQIVNEKFNIERHIADLVNIYTKVSSSTHTA